MYFEAQKMLSIYTHPTYPKYGVREDGLFVKFNGKGIPHPILCKTDVRGNPRYNVGHCKMAPSQLYWESRYHDIVDRDRKVIRLHTGLVKTIANNVLAMNRSDKQVLNILKEKLAEPEKNAVCFRKNGVPITLQNVADETDFHHFLTESDASDFLNVSPTTVSQWVRFGKKECTNKQNFITYQLIYDDKYVKNKDYDVDCCIPVSVAWKELKQHRIFSSLGSLCRDERLKGKVAEIIIDKHRNRIVKDKGVYSLETYREIFKTDPDLVLFDNSLQSIEVRFLNVDPKCQLYFWLRNILRQKRFANAWLADMGMRDEEDLDPLIECILNGPRPCQRTALPAVENLEKESTCQKRIRTVPDWLIKVARPSCCLDRAELRATADPSDSDFKGSVIESCQREAKDEIEPEKKCEAKRMKTQ